MIKVCEICENKFETKSSTRIYCYECSGESTRINYESVLIVAHSGVSKAFYGYFEGIENGLFLIKRKIYKKSVRN